MTRVISEAEVDALPVDLTTMRAGAALLLAEDSGRLSDDGLETLRLQMRGHAEVLIPVVERAATRPSVDSRLRDSALACVWNAQENLRLGCGDTRLVRAAVAERLARSVRTLCGQFERLGGDQP